MIEWYFIGISLHTDFYKKDLLVSCDLTDELQTSVHILYVLYNTERNVFCLTIKGVM